MALAVWTAANMDTFGCSLSSDWTLYLVAGGDTTFNVTNKRLFNITTR
ncbi:MAG: hypothetical protein IPH96_11975 [Saprospiraceae bacterium]|nr:hypothetical protein [Saprospiraceae bacterium]